MRRFWEGEDDEAVFHLETHVFTVNEQVSKPEPDRQSPTFPLAAVA